jgi:hypothetical protein
VVNYDPTGSQDHDIHEEEKGKPGRRPGHRGEHIDYGDFRDKINTRFARIFSKSFRKQFNEWRDDSPHHYKISRDKDADQGLIDAHPEEVKPKTDYDKDTPDEHKHYDVKYDRLGIHWPEIPWRKIEIPWKKIGDFFKAVWGGILIVLKLLLTLLKLVVALSVGLFIGVRNLFSKHKWGWGWANEVTNEKGFHLLSFGMGDYNRYSMIGTRIHPTGKQLIHPKQDAMIGYIGKSKSRSHHRPKRPSAFITIGQSLNSGRNLVRGPGSHHRRHHRRYHLKH